MVGMVLRGEANFSACGVTMLTERSEVIDFSVPLFTSSFRIFIRKKAEREVVGVNDYLSPFSRGLWMALLVTTLVAAILMVLQYRFMHHFEVHRDESLDISDAILFVFGVVFCQQAPASRARQLSLRLMQVSVYMAGLVAISSYSGTLISALTVFIPRLPFTDLEGLNKSSFILGVGNNSVSYHSFKTAKQGVMADLYKKHMADGHSLETKLSTAFSRVCREKYAYIAASEALDVKRVECDVTYLPESFMKGSLGLVFPRGSPYKGVFNYMLLKMMENGVLSNFHKTAWPRMISATSTSLKSIAYTDIHPLLSLLLLGMFLSLAVLFCEICRPPGLDRRAETIVSRRYRRVNVISRRAGPPPQQKFLFK